MSKIVLVTGGARSGKSSFAENYVRKDLGEAVALYLATARVAENDAEMRQRVEHHRRQRPAHWITLEATDNLAASCASILDEEPGAAAILLDCLTLLLSYSLVSRENGASLTADIEQEVEQAVSGEISALIQLCRARDTLLVLVTNEVGSGIVPEYPLGRIFRDLAGRINQHVAAQADEVYLLVSGLPLRLKG